MAELHPPDQSLSPMISRISRTVSDTNEGNVAKKVKLILQRGRKWLSIIRLYTEQLGDEDRRAYELLWRFGKGHVLVLLCPSVT